MRILGLLFIAAVTLTGLSAQAKLFIRPSGVYIIDNTTSGTATTNYNRLVFDGLVGWKFVGPLAIGGTYNYDNASSTSSGATSTFTYSGYGPTVGLVGENAFVDFTYFVSAQYQTVAGGATTTYSSGSGYKLAAGYLFKVGGVFSFGPEFMYRYIATTQKAVGSGTASSYTYNDTEFFPMVAFNFAL